MGVSAATGEGMDDFFAAIAAAAEEYRTDYLVELSEAVAERRAADAERRRVDLERLKSDLMKEEAAEAKRGNRKKAGPSGSGSSLPGTNVADGATGTS